ncbi:MAG: FkbM family methyltransferase, partial [Bacteroidota bacterium]
KKYFVNIMEQVNWKETTLPAKKISLGAKTEIFMVPHVHEFDFDSLIWQRLPYEPELYDWWSSQIHRYDLIIDIGANVGVFSIFSAKTNPQAQVYSFEPSREAFRRLGENCRVNRVKNLTVFNVAIADKAGFLDFFEPKGHLVNGSLDASFSRIFDPHPDVKKVLGIPGTELESLLRQSRKRVLIKLDVEGAESLILRQLRPILEKYKPDLLIEVLDIYQEQLDALPFLRQEYELLNVTDKGLVRHENFESHQHFRDYFLRPLPEIASVGGGREVAAMPVWARKRMFSRNENLRKNGEESAFWSGRKPAVAAPLSKF